MQAEDDFHAGHVFRHHAKAVLSAWARSLRYFRFVSGPGGMLDNGDRLMVALRAPHQSDVERIFAALGVAARPLPPDPAACPGEYVRFAGPPTGSPGSGDLPLLALGGVRVRGATVTAYRTTATLELWLADEAAPTEVTAAAVESAQRIEPLLEPLAGLIIDPPQADRNCVCPRYYPWIWDPAAANGRGKRRSHKARAASRRRRLALLALVVGALLWLLVTAIWWERNGGFAGRTVPRDRFTRALFELGGWALVIGAFLLPGLVLFFSAWRILRARPPQE